MWIRERFFDTSRRHETGFAVRLLAAAGFLALVFAGSCVVTDKIAFEDWKNQQISIERFLPESPTVQVAKAVGTADNRRPFTVKVSDADVLDTENVKIAGRLLYQVDNWSDVRSMECGVPTVEPQDQINDGPPVFRITCGIDIVAETGMGLNNLVYIRLLVSDLGFLRGDPVRGATTAEVLWMAERSDADQ